MSKKVGFLLLLTLALSACQDSPSPGQEVDNRITLTDGTTVEVDYNATTARVQFTASDTVVGLNADDFIVTGGRFTSVSTSRTTVVVNIGLTKNTDGQMRVITVGVNPSSTRIRGETTASIYQSFEGDDRVVLTGGSVIQVEYNEPTANVSFSASAPGLTGLTAEDFNINGGTFVSASAAGTTVTVTVGLTENTGTTFRTITVSVRSLTSTRVRGDGVATITQLFANAYLLFVNFDVDPYASLANGVIFSGATPGGTTGPGGWRTGAAGLGANDHFRVVNHTHLSNKRAVEFAANDSASQVIINLGSPILQGTGIYGLSFDVELHVPVPGPGYYRINFLRGDPANTPVHAAGVQFFGDRSTSIVRFGNSANTQLTGVLWPRWYRVKAIIDSNARTIRWFFNATEEEYSRDSGILTTNIDFTNGLAALSISGMSPTEGRLLIDNLRLFIGDTDPVPVPWLTGQREPSTTIYLFNETFTLSSMRLFNAFRGNEFLFDPTNTTATNGRWTRAGAMLGQSMQFIEHTKIQDQSVIAMTINGAEANHFQYAFPNPVMPGENQRLTISFDFYIDPRGDVSTQDFYRISLVSGGNRIDESSIRLFTDGRVMGSGDVLVKQIDNQSYWHRVSITYELRSTNALARYFIDHDFVPHAGQTFNVPGNITAIRFNGPNNPQYTGRLVIHNFRAYMGDFGCMFTTESNPPPVVDNSVYLRQFPDQLLPFNQTVLYEDMKNTDWDFTFGWTTDAQNIVRRRPHLHIQNIGWLADNRDALNLKWVFNTGDLKTGSERQVWLDSHEAQAALDRAGIPNAVIAGNHDWENNFREYQEFFGAWRFHPDRSGPLGDFHRGNTWYRYYWNDNVGSASILEIHGVKFLFVNMSTLYQVNDHAIIPDFAQAELAARVAWINDILQRYPNHVAILAFHQHLTGSPSGGNGTGRLGKGAHFWEHVVVPNNNVFMVLCGHALGTWRRAIPNVNGVQGRTVHEILYNYQGSEEPNGNGNALRYRRDMWGMIRLMFFDVAGNQIHFRTFSPINDSITIWPYINSPEPAPRDRDQFSIPFDFNKFAYANFNR